MFGNVSSMNSSLNQVAIIRKIKPKMLKLKETDLVYETNAKLSKHINHDFWTVFEERDKNGETIVIVTAFVQGNRV